MSRVTIIVLCAYIIFQEYLIYGYSEINYMLQKSLVEVMTACLGAR